MEQSLNTLVDPETGLLDRISHDDKLPVPAAVAEGNQIVFDFSKRIRHRNAPSDLLERFLDSESNADLVRFAHSYGPLALFRTQPGELPWPNPERLSGYCDDPHREELSDWRRYQQQMKSALSLMGTVNDGNTPTVEDLAAFNATVGGTFLPSNVLDRVKTKAKWRRDLAARAALFYTEALAYRCRLRPALRYRNDKIDLVFRDAAEAALSLPGALTLRLMSVYAGNLPTICSSCGNAYIPTRKPAAGRNRFCEACGEQGSWKLSKRKTRRPQEDQ